MTAPLSREAAIQARLDAVEPYPWEWFEDSNSAYVADAADDEAIIGQFVRKPTAQFVAHAPEDVAYLLAENEKLRQKMEQAPHAQFCRSRYAVGFPSREYHECNCWKARAALTDEGKTE